MIFLPKSLGGFCFACLTQNAYAFQSVGIFKNVLILLLFISYRKRLSSFQSTEVTVSMLMHIVITSIKLRYYVISFFYDGAFGLEITKILLVFILQICMSKSMRMQTFGKCKMFVI
jgi:hypothetical protein